MAAAVPVIDPLQQAEIKRKADIEEVKKAVEAVFDATGFSMGEREFVDMALGGRIEELLASSNPIADDVKAPDSFLRNLMADRFEPSGNVFKLLVRAIAQALPPTPPSPKTIDTLLQTTLHKEIDDNTNPDHFANDAAKTNRKAHIDAILARQSIDSPDKEDIHARAHLCDIISTAAGAASNSELMAQVYRHVAALATVEEAGPKREAQANQILKTAEMDQAIRQASLDIAAEQLKAKLETATYKKDSSTTEERYFSDAEVTIIVAKAREGWDKDSRGQLTTDINAAKKVGDALKQEREALRASYRQLFKRLNDEAIVRVLDETTRKQILAVAANLLAENYGKRAPCPDLENCLGHVLHTLHTLPIYEPTGVDVGVLNLDSVRYAQATLGGDAQTNLTTQVGAWLNEVYLRQRQTNPTVTAKYRTGTLEFTTAEGSPIGHSAKGQLVVSLAVLQRCEPNALGQSADLALRKQVVEAARQALLTSGKMSFIMQDGKLQIDPSKSATVGLSAVDMALKSIMQEALLAIAKDKTAYAHVKIGKLPEGAEGKAMYEEFISKGVRPERFTDAINAQYGAKKDATATSGATTAGTLPFAHLQREAPKFGAAPAVAAAG